MFTPAQSVRLAQITARVRAINDESGTRYAQLSLCEQDRDDLHDLLMFALARVDELAMELHDATEAGRVAGR